MTDRRVFVKFIILSPFVVYSSKSNAFFPIPGIFVRFIARGIGSLLSRNVVKRTATQLSPKLVSKGTNSTKVTSKSYKIGAKDKAEKLVEIIKGINTVTDIVDAISELTWNRDKENNGTIVVVNDSDTDITVPSIDVDAIGENGELTRMNIPSATLKPNDGYAVELGYYGLPVGQNKFSVQQGSASRLFEQILVAESTSAKSDNYTPEPPNNTATKLFDQTLGN